MDDELRAREGMPDTLEGLYVARLGPGPLADAGLAEGDVILDADHQGARDVSALAAQWAQARGSGLLLRVWRSGDVRFVGVAVP